MTHPHLLELERIERQAWEDLVRLAPPSFAQAVGLESAVLGGAYFVMAAKIPQFQFNFLCSVGLGDDDGACIADAVHRFKNAGQSKFIVQIPPGPKTPRMEALAREAGLQASPLAWAKFMRTVDNARAVETSLMIREVGHDERDVFAQTAVAGFGMPAAMAAWLSCLVGQPGWRAYVSFDGATPAGAGALYVDGDFAWCGIGATKPDMRRKGGQSALLARRVADAARFGAKFVATETGVPQEGQRAPSYKNILSSGFEVAYVRPNWTLPS